MKIFTRIMALAAVAAASFTANAATDINIRFLRPEAWKATPHVHVYCAAGDLANNQEMTAVAGEPGWFSYELKDAPDGYNVMFNNGGWDGGQSINDMYEAVAGNYSYTLDSDLKVVRWVNPAAPTATIRFIRPDSWTGVPHIHIYHAVEGGTDVTDVNDTPMTPVAGSDNTFEYIFRDHPANYNVMFNNGGWSGGQVGPYFEENPADATYKVEGDNLVKDTTTGTGIVIATSTDAPVYYTLQGLRTDRPEKGIYIRIENGKASKVRF